MEVNGITVIMPTFNQASFLPRAISSLKKQIFTNWQLIIVNDGSTDCTNTLIQNYLEDERILTIENIQNKGLGFCLNQGIKLAIYDLIAYLPSDDIYFSNHLESLYHKISNSEAHLVYSGVQIQLQNSVNFEVYTYDNEQNLEIPLQLVQVLHYKTTDKWLERSKLVTDDYHAMFWHKFFTKFQCTSTQLVTCEWVDHPDQRHKIINEQLGGGIHLYKQFYQVNEPLKFHSTGGNLIDETKHYKQFKHSRICHDDSLKILIVGELAFNPERIIAFEELGHKLYGLWIDSPGFFNTTGPLPFGQVEEVKFDNWLTKIQEIKPDIIYALLNYPAVPLAYTILNAGLEIPFIWHLKESPFICRQKGLWPQIMDLYTLADGVIHCSQEIEDWVSQFIPDIREKSFILDGDLPKREWFFGERKTLLSLKDGEFHTVLAGRPVGLGANDIYTLGEQKIHLHFYGDVHQKGQGGYWLNQVVQSSPNYFHIHSNCDQENWLSELSQYDAGWLHFFKSKNQMELMRASWNDLNIPARVATYALAGLPMIQPQNLGHIVATQSITQQLDMGIFVNDIAELSVHLMDKNRISIIRENVWKNRMNFCFDSHTGNLVNYFRSIIKQKTR